MIEHELTRWRQENARRDALVRSAYESGLTKHRIHILSGIARSTIDRILKGPQHTRRDRTLERY